MKLSVKQYAEILDKSLAEASSEDQRSFLFKDFAKLLINEGKTSKLDEVLHIWKSLYNKRHGLIDVEIESVDGEASFPHSFAGKRTAINHKNNPSLIGGTITRISDYVIDTSIKSKIKSLKE